jgi:GNAT superfamily N-acetyltransferase
MDIRFFQPDDTESLADVLYDMSRHYHGENASTREIVGRNLIENILGPDSDVRIVVAVDDGHVVGVAMISILYPAPKERAELFMKELYVVSDRRLQGTGKQLMTWIAQYAIAKNCSRFDWTVDAGNSAGLAFYGALGTHHERDKLYFRVAGPALQEFAGQDAQPGSK